METLLSRSQQWLRENRRGPTAPMPRSVTQVFPSGPDPDLVHFLIVTKEVLESLDYVGDLDGQVFSQRLKGIESFSDFPSPSSGVSTHDGVVKVVDRAKDKFHSGRPAENFGPPACLFNSHLGLFDYHMSHLDDETFPIELSPSLIGMAHRFMIAAARTYDPESSRASNIKGLLSGIFFIPLEWEISPARFNIKPDAIISGKTPFFVVEVKNEAGLEGDASLQAALSYAHIATTRDPRNENKVAALHSNFPAVLYGIMGNLLEIGVATYTDGVYHNLLFSERLHLGFFPAKSVLRLARAFAATREVITALDASYNHPPGPGSLAHLFPSPVSIPTYTDNFPSLTFTGRLSRSGKTDVLAKDENTRQSGIYLATMTSNGEDAMMASSVGADTSEVVVKFTPQYHPEAHALLAKEGLAPTLHACVPVCGRLFMVVMDRVHGETAWQIGRRGELLPISIFEDINKAIDLLHSKYLVFGDLRSPNIMVVSDNSSSHAQSHGMLVDFDWVGLHDIGRYPASLDDGLDDWTGSGITRYGIMKRAHDLFMLAKFKGRCHWD